MPITQPICHAALKCEQMSYKFTCAFQNFSTHLPKPFSSVLFSSKRDILASITGGVSMVIVSPFAGMKQLTPETLPPSPNSSTPAHKRRTKLLQHLLFKELHLGIFTMDQHHILRFCLQTTSEVHASQVWSSEVLPV